MSALLGILQECINNEKFVVRRSALNVLTSILLDDVSINRKTYIKVSNSAFSVHGIITVVLPQF